MSEKSSLMQRSASAGPSRYGAIKEDDYNNRYYGSQPSSHFTKRDCIIVFIVLVLAITSIALSLAFGLPALQAKKARYFNLTTDPSAAVLYNFKENAVATDAEYCAPIGNEILKQGGSAVDAAIASLFCNGAVNPHSMGIGGGILFTVYDHEKKQAKVIDGREAAPVSNEWAQEGGLSIAIPGELRAYKLAHEAYGKLTFSKLIEPTIKLCKDGFKVTNHLSTKFTKYSAKIIKDPGLKQAFVDPATGKVYQEGQTIHCTKLAETLEAIVKDGPDSFYNGTLAQAIVDDIQTAGGNFTAEELAGYEARSRDAVTTTLANSKYNVYSAPPPSSGPVLAFMLNILDGYGYTASDGKDIASATTMYQRFAETLKHGFAAKSHLTDLEFLKDQSFMNKLLTTSYADEVRRLINDSATFDAAHYKPTEGLVEDKGTAQVTVVTPTLSVTATSSINSNFGSMFRSTKTGIIYNDHMADFNKPRSSSVVAPNDVEAGKRPMSSMCPTVITDSEGQIVLVLGGAGGTRILSGQALIAFRVLFLGKSIKEAIDEPRLHHQLFPNNLYAAPEFPGVLKDNLRSIGHTVDKEKTASSFIAVAKTKDSLQAYVEITKPGSVAGQ